MGEDIKTFNKAKYKKLQSHSMISVRLCFTCESEEHLTTRAPVGTHCLEGSPEVPAGHLHLKLPIEFSQRAPWPQGLALHSSTSMQARWMGRSWKPGRHRHMGMPLFTKHCELGKQVAVSQGSGGRQRKCRLTLGLNDSRKT